MKKIVIIAAMDEEVKSIENIMDNIVEKHIYNIEIVEGNINNRECVLVKSGVGKVNAARTVQILIDNYDIDFVINVGSAGSLDEKLNIGDIVIGKGIVQHDFDITAFGHEKGYISEVGKIFESDYELVDMCKNSIDTLNLNKVNVEIGIIASGDIFCTSVEMKNKIKEKFNAKCVEMEGAAIAQVCYLDNIRFIVIRSISDSPNGNNNIDFNEFLDLASVRCAMFLKEMIK